MRDKKDLGGAHEAPPVHNPERRAIGQRCSRRPSEGRGVSPEVDAGRQEGGARSRGTGARGHSAGSEGVRGGRPRRQGGLGRGDVQKGEECMSQRSAELAA
jgi:hypothetical protein